MGACGCAVFDVVSCAVGVVSCDGVGVFCGFVVLFLRPGGGAFGGGIALLALSGVFASSVGVAVVAVGGAVGGDCFIGAGRVMLSFVVAAVVFGSGFGGFDACCGGGPGGGGGTCVLSFVVLFVWLAGVGAFVGACVAASCRGVSSAWVCVSLVLCRSCCCV